jgi:hypothetical protein
MTVVKVSPQRLLLFGWLLTNVLGNITTMLYDTGHTRIYITLHYYSCSSFLHLFHSSGRLAVLHSLCPLQLEPAVAEYVYTFHMMRYG